MITRLKKIGATLAICLMLGGAGIVSGSVVQDVVSPTPVVAACDNDECNDGTTCISNGNNETECDVKDGGACDTLSCGGWEWPWVH